MTGRTLTEISPATQGTKTTVVKTGTGTLPTPPVVDATLLATSDDEAEKWEGVPITLKNVAVIEAPGPFSGGADDQHEMKVTGPVIVQSVLALLGENGAEFKLNDCLASLTGVVDYFYDYHLLPRSPADIVSGGTECPKPPDTTEVSIVDIQNGTIAPGTAVELKDVVVTAVAKFRTVTAQNPVEEHRIWVADSGTAVAQGGIMLFKPAYVGTDIDTLKVGDVVTVSGNVTEFDQNPVGGLTLTQVTQATLTKGTTTAPVTPLKVTAAQLADPNMAEALEGVLVELDKQLVVTGTDSHNEWTVGTAEAAARLDDMMLAPPAGLAVGDCYTKLVGVIDFAFDLYKIQPRSADDVVKGADPAACQ
jgi:hypothetical protein